VEVIINQLLLEVNPKMSSFINNNPRLKENQQQRPNYIQGGRPVQKQPGLGEQLGQAAMSKGISAAMTPGGLVGTAPVLNAAGTVTQAATTGLLGTGGAIAPMSGSLLGGLTSAAAPAAAAAVPAAATGAGMAAGMAPMLAAAGPLALLALPFLLNDGTNKVPEQDFGPDPLAQGYNNGTNMAYAGGTDSVPAMLTPGEAVIPAAAAQNPNNKPMINSMINEGRNANAVANGQPQTAMTPPQMAGPLSGKVQREQMKLMQDMSFKKKAFESEEMRKQMAFEQKMSQGNMKAMLAMRQSQE
jgi:hypothetical protein